MNEQQHGMTGAWALDALDEDERALVEAYLAEDPEAAAEAHGFVETAAQIAEGLDPVAPRPAVREALVARIAETRQLPPEPAQDPDPVHEPAGATEAAPSAGAEQAPSVPLERYRRSVRRSRWFALAAGALLATTVAGMGMWSTERATSEQAQATIEALQSAQSGDAQQREVMETIMAADDAAHLEVPSDTGGTLDVMYSAEEGSMLVTGTSLEDLPAGRAYQLWLIDEGGHAHPSEMLPAGDGTATVQGDMDGITGLGLTVEPAGGSQQPTGDVIAQGSL